MKTMPISDQAITAAQQLSPEDCLVGLPKEIAARLRQETTSPIRAALALKDCFWVTNPYVDEPEATRATRIVTREEGMQRCLAWYMHKGGEEVESFYESLERTMAPSNPHDGKVSHTTV